MAAGLARPCPPVFPSSPPPPAGQKRCLPMSSRSWERYTFAGTKGGSAFRPTSWRRFGCASGRASPCASCGLWARGRPTARKACTRWPRPLPWEDYLTPATTFAVEATLTKSEHAHSGFVALKLKDAIVDRMRARTGQRPDVDSRSPDVRILAHLAGTRLQLSLDLAGEPLNRRGYRVRQTTAPLKETLAAAMLRAARFTGEEPVLDPMCGSATLLIEAAWVAARRAPSLLRSFAVERWPELGPKARPLLAELRAEAQAAQRPVAVPLWGFDRDEEALGAARANVRAAGLTGPIQLKEADATRELPLPTDARGLLLTNPPYGDRLGTGRPEGNEGLLLPAGRTLRRARPLPRLHSLRKPGLRERLPPQAVRAKGALQRPHSLHPPQLQSARRRPRLATPTPAPEAQTRAARLTP